MRVAGADACRGGWIAVLYDGRVARARLFRDFASLWEGVRGEAELVLADVPIGLPPPGEVRRCDLLARRLLQRRGASVFPVPCRRVVYSESYTEASRLNFRLTGRRLSLQSWYLCRRIREVDALLLRCGSAREVVRETHPELCFFGLAGRVMRYSKRCREGREERRRVLERWCRLGGSAPSHDLLDALAAAVTAWLGLRQGFEVLPPEGEVDEMGLRMEILYHRRRS